LKNNFQLQEEVIGIILLWGILDPTAVQDCTKVPILILITNVLLQLVRDITYGVC